MVIITPVTVPADVPAVGWRACYHATRQRGDLRERLKTLVSEGHRLRVSLVALHIPLWREGHVVNKKRVKQT